MHKYIPRSLEAAMLMSCQKYGLNTDYFAYDGQVIWLLPTYPIHKITYRNIQVLYDNEA